MSCLDILLPDTDGRTLCRTIRQRELPARVLMLTARTLESDLVQGFIDVARCTPHIRPMQAWRVVESRTLLERQWLTVREQRVVLPTGVEIEQFHLIESPDWVAVLALTPAGKVVLVDQYRHGLGRLSRELPAGVREPGESPEQTAARELLEETGYRAHRYRPLLEVASEPCRHTHRAHFLVAWGAERVAPQSMDRAENIAVALLPAAELVAAVERGEIAHGVHVGAILLAERRGWLAAEPPPQSC